MNPLAQLALMLARKQGQGQSPEGDGAFPQRVAPTQTQGPWQPQMPNMGGESAISGGQGQYHPMQMQALQKEHEKTLGQAAKLRQKADEAERNAMALLPKPQRAPTSPRDILPLAIGSALAALFGAKEGDIAQGLGGFLQGREGWANRENENEAAQFKARQMGMAAEAQPLRTQADALEELGKYQRGRADKIADDIMDFNQQKELAGEAEKNRLKIKELEVNGRKASEWARRNQKLADDMPEGPTKSRLNQLIGNYVNNGFLDQMEVSEAAELAGKATNKNLKDANAIEKGGIDIERDKHKLTMALKFDDPTLQAKLDNLLKTGKKLDVETLIKDKDLFYYDENMRWKRIQQAIPIWNLQRGMASDAEKAFLNRTKPLRDARDKAEAEAKSYRTKMEADLAEMDALVVHIDPDTNEWDDPANQQKWQAAQKRAAHWRGLMGVAASTAQTLTSQIPVMEEFNTTPGQVKQGLEGLVGGGGIDKSGGFAPDSPFPTALPPWLTAGTSPDFAKNEAMKMYPKDNQGAASWLRSVQRSVPDLETRKMLEKAIRMLIPAKSKPVAGGVVGAGVGSSTKESKGSTVKVIPRGFKQGGG